MSGRLSSSGALPSGLRGSIRPGEIEGPGEADRRHGDGPWAFRWTQSLAIWSRDGLSRGWASAREPPRPDRVPPRGLDDVMEGS